MPCTCRAVTHPDNALLCPRMSPLLTEIQVIDEPWFDCHKVVTFSLKIPKKQVTIPSSKTPGLSWIFPLILIFFQMHIKMLPKNGVTRITWKLGESPLKVLSIKVIAIPKWPLTKFRSPWPKDFRRPTVAAAKKSSPKWCVEDLWQSHIEMENTNQTWKSIRFATQKKVKKIRRLDSVCRGLRRLQDSHPEPPSLLQEWRAVLRCEGFKGNFIKWAMLHPEIGPLPWNLPSLQLATTILQMARHETNIAIQYDYKFWQRKLSFKRHLHTKLGRFKHAFQTMKSSNMEELETL